MRHIPVGGISLDSDPHRHCPWAETALSAGRFNLTTS